MSEGFESIYERIVAQYNDPDDPRLGHVLFENSRRQRPVQDARVFILGVPDDRGVVSNGGRGGAALGPAAFREYFGRLVPFKGAELVFDLGDIDIKNDIEASHEALADRVRHLMMAYPDALVVVIGGGHDYAFGEVKGVVLGRPGKKVGIGNIDAHLDVRPVHNGNITSGTPFWRLWQGFQNQIGYHLTFGVQEPTTAACHLVYLESRRSKVVFAQELQRRRDQEKRIHDECDLLFSATDHICLNVDLDAISMAYAPGVSAPAALGLDPQPVVAVLERFAKNPFLKTVGLYELNPTVDFQDQTARLVAQMTYQLCQSRVMSKYAAPKGLNL